MSVPPVPTAFRPNASRRVIVRASDTELLGRYSSSEDVNEWSDSADGVSSGKEDVAVPAAAAVDARDSVRRMPPRQSPQRRHHVPRRRLVPGARRAVGKWGATGSGGYYSDDLDALDDDVDVVWERNPVQGVFGMLWEGNNRKLFEPFRNTTEEEEERMLATLVGKYVKGKGRRRGARDARAPHEAYAAIPKRIRSVVRQPAHAAALAAIEARVLSLLAGSLGEGVTSVRLELDTPLQRMLAHGVAAYYGLHSASHDTAAHGRVTHVRALGPIRAVSADATLSHFLAELEKTAALCVEMRASAARGRERRHRRKGKGEKKKKKKKKGTSSSSGGDGEWVVV